MHPSALLDLAAELLRQLLKFDQPADMNMAAFFRKHRGIGSRERQALAETAWRLLRDKPLVEHLARITPPPAMGFERRLAAIAWQGSAASLAAALSPAEQAWLSHVREVDRGALPDALRHNLPGWLAVLLQQQAGADFWPLVAALDRPAPLDLRVNPLKARRTDVQRTLAAAGITAEPTVHSPWGLRVEGKPALKQLPLYTQGAIEVQDEGSQLLALLTDAKRNELAVDFCAGAGGKTLALGAAMRNTGRLYAFDVSGHRLDALKPRLARSGLANVHAAQIAHERDERLQRLAGKADRVLVDAPCSGLGTLRRNPDLKWRQTPATLAALRTLQASILASAARLLKPGGRLVYATCSLLQAEDEDIADAFGAAHAAQFERLDAAVLLTAAQVAGADALVAGPNLRLWPHRHGSDGFFAAAWQRR